MVVKGRPLADRGDGRRARPTTASQQSTKARAILAHASWDRCEEQSVEQSEAQARGWQGYLLTRSAAPASAGAVPWAEQHSWLSPTDVARHCCATRQSYCSEEQMLEQRRTVAWPWCDPRSVRHCEEQSMEQKVGMPAGRAQGQLVPGERSLRPEPGHTRCCEEQSGAQS